MLCEHARTHLQFDVWNADCFFRQLVYASAVKDLHEEQLLPAALTNATMTRARSSGGWVELPEFGAHLGVTHAAQHMVQQHQGTVVPAEFHEHTVTSVKAQVVAGANYKITMTAKHVTTGDLHTIDGVVHRDSSGHHSMKYLGLPRFDVSLTLAIGSTALLKATNAGLTLLHGPIWYDATDCMAPYGIIQWAYT